jgi:DNA end-binding protein Ku
MLAPAGVNESGRRDAAMRMVWKGSISFGLVTIPVRLYVATESKNVPSHQVHLSDGGRVQYKRVCSVDGAEVPYEEVGRGYETASGEMVVLSDVDLAMLPQPNSRSIDVVSFVPEKTIDPIVLDRSYYVEPESQAAKAYLLLRDALKKSERVAVAKVTLRDRELIALLRVHSDVLVLATMLWPDEVRTPRFPFLADEESSAPAQELAMAEALIDSLSDEDLDPGRYRDVHREALTALIDAKATGRPLIQDAQAGAGPLDLLTALKASVEAAKQRKSTGAEGVRRRAPSTSGASTKKPKKPVPTGRGSGPPKKRG